jgi:tetratricopeptide (TPR) repeat protein
MEQLVVLYLKAGKPDRAEELLYKLFKSYPNEPLYCDRLATFLVHRGRGEEAATCYQQLLAAKPELNNIRYNLALLLKQQGHLQQALQEYRDCLQHNIEQPEQVLSNISVIHSELHQHKQAQQALESALEHNPDYIPALFSLGLLQEERGNWPTASTHYRHMLKLQPMHPGALARLANGDRITDPTSPLVAQMEKALKQKALEDGYREELLYALGKSQDDCGLFDRGFDLYQQANTLSRKRCGGYDRSEQQARIDQLIATTGPDWLDSIEPVSEAPLIFICGMFRSGTTLLEQILGAHPAITPGGEIDFFQRKIEPSSTINVEQLRSTGRGYLQYLEGHFPAGTRVSNKQPDNFLLLGGLKALFPKASFFHTQRHPLDNCVSLFFQPLDSRQPHANSLLDIGHYYVQYQRLMRHWRQLLGTAVMDVVYESVVQKPRETIKDALAFLQLDWHEECMNFHRASNRVRTASVHQVRQPLYNRSCGRWNNYSEHLGELRQYLHEQGKGDKPGIAE